MYQQNYSVELIKFCNGSMPTAFSVFYSNSNRCPGVYSGLVASNPLLYLSWSFTLMMMVQMYYVISADKMQCLPQPNSSIVSLLLVNVHYFKTN